MPKQKNEYKLKHNPCVLCLIENVDTNQIMMVENLRGINQGFYSFPGGKLEYGESLNECLYREVKEETGLSLKKAKCLGRFDIEDIEDINSPDRFSKRDNMHVYVFYSKDFSGNVSYSADEVKCFWMDKDKIPYDKMRDNDKVWLEDALDLKKFHKSFFRDENGNLKNIKHDDEDVDDLLTIRLRQYEMMKGSYQR